MRKPYFDNLKFVLIGLVVFGHFLGMYRLESRFLAGLYMFLYTFHMPVFAFVSGALSTRYQPGVKDVAFLLIPYVVFQLVYVSYYHGLGMDHGMWSGGMSLSMPFEHNWYLLSLVGWRLMSLYARQWQHALAFSIVAGLLIGFVPSFEWRYSASRTICFFPFFLIGLQSTTVGLEKLSSYKALGWAVLVGMLVGCLGISFIRPATADLIIWTSYYASGYEWPAQWVSGPVYRVAMYGMSIIGGTALAAIIPHGECWYTRLGVRTMSVYLLHNFFVLGLKKIYPHYQPWMTEGVLLACAIGTIFLLSTKWVHQGLQYPFIMMNRLLKNNEQLES